MDATAMFMLSAASLKMVWSFLNSGGRIPKRAELVGQVAEITLYPFKSMRGMQLESAECTARGLKYPHREIFDRNFMVVDSKNRFVTARNQPKMATIHCTVAASGDQLTLSCEGMTNLTLPSVPQADLGQTVTTNVWGERVEGQDCGKEAAEWLSKCLQKPGCRLLYGKKGLQQRELIHQEESWKKLAKEGDMVTFQDGFPYMLVSQGSLADLNRVKGGETFGMARFRPNLVISSCTAFDEDSWSEVWIGKKVKFSNLKPCVRCVFTTVDPSTGQKHPEEEPLRTLRKYRLNKALFGTAPKFGVNLVLDRTNGEEISVGDPVYVMRNQSNF